MLTIRLVALLSLLIVACAPSMATAQSDGLPPMMLLQRVPAGAVEIADAMRNAKPGESIVIRGRVTEGADVFVNNRAILRLADEAAMPACCAPGAQSSGTACTVPANRRATVQFLDTRERLIRLGLRGMHGLAVGKEVFIVGTVLQADNDRTLIINATGMHVPQGDIPIGLMVDSAPEGAVDVADARRTAKVGERVVVRGRVGGDAQPFVDGRAAVTIVGAAVRDCSEAAEGACKTPWDACAMPRTEVVANSATVQVVDERGEPIRTDLRGRRDLRELSEVTVSGVVTSTSDGALIIRATTIHVRDDHAPDARAAARP